MLDSGRYLERSQHDYVMARVQHMKSNNYFKLSLLGATAITLVACGEAKNDVLAYENVEACIAAGQQDASVCEAEFASAQAMHEEVAPQYSSSNSCNTDFGYNRCYQHRNTSGTNIWLPFMMGYMLAPRGSRFVASQPLYRQSSDPNSFYTAGAGRVGTVSSNGRAQVATSQTARPTAARTRTVGRGGFGARATGGRGAGS